MTTEDTFTFQGAYGREYPNCNFKVSRYMDNKNLALIIEHKESNETIAIATVNTGDKLPDDRICVKNYSENDGMDDFLLKLGIIEGEPVTSILLPHATVPVYMLSESGKELFSGV